MSAGNILINQGTQTNVPVDTIGTVNYPIVKLDVGALGASSPFTTTPTLPGTSYGTVGTTGGAVFGTLVPPAGAGTKVYIQGASIVVTSGTVDCAIVIGTFAGPNGAGVVERGQFSAGGGIAQQYNPILITGTNGTVTYYMGGAGTAAFNVKYYNL